MQIDSWNIEPEFLHPVVKSARQLSTYSVRFEDCTQWLFSCPHTIQELRAMGKHGAADYIAWGETQSAPPRQKRAQPVPWPEVASVQSNRPWHYVRVLETVPILCSRFLDRRFFFPWCRDAVMEDQTFYGLTLFQPEHEALVAALLNSTLSFALLELMARTNLGEGVLQYARGDMADFPVINPTLYTECEREKIELCFSAMAERPVLPVVDEVACEDRNALDRLILTPWLKTLACSEDVDGFRARLVEALLRRMDERIIMARSLRKNKTR